MQKSWVKIDNTHTHKLDVTTRLLTLARICPHGIYPYGESPTPISISLMILVLFRLTVLAVF